MMKSYTKTKGHKTDEVKYHIPYWNKQFFSPTSKKEDDEDTKKIEMVIVPVKINKSEKEKKQTFVILNYVESPTSTTTSKES